MEAPQQRLAARFAPVARRLVPDGRLTGVRQLTGGMSAQITVLEITRPGEPPETVVVREYGPKNVATDPRPATTETRLLALLLNAGVPVPRPRIADDGVALLGGPYSVISYVDGTGPAAAWTDDLADQLTGVLVRLHRLDPSPARCWLPPYADRIERWLARRPDDPDEAMRETGIRAVLGPWWRRRDELPSRILHGDFWPGNTMWSDGRLRAVIDWEDAALGDQRSDLANIRLELLWAYGPDAAEDFTHRYRDAFPDVDFADQPYWDLVAATRPVGRLAEWGLDPDRLQAFLKQFQYFVDTAMLTRGATPGPPGAANTP